MFLRLLTSDIDGTLLSHTDREAEAAIRAEFMRLFIPRPSGTLLCYASGRSLEKILDAIVRYNLPEPDALICDVGTSLYLQAQNPAEQEERSSWELDSGYQRLLSESWQGKSAGDALALVASCSDLRLQEERNQSEFKLSFYTSLETDPEHIRNHLSTLLVSGGMPSNVIFSTDRARGYGLVDILPLGAAKDRAMFYFAAQHQIPKSSIVYAGDSGNDLAAFVSGVRAIVVSNTDQSVKDEVRAWAKREGEEEQVYFSTADCVAGVLEGLSHHAFFSLG